MHAANKNDSVVSIRRRAAIGALVCRGGRYPRVHIAATLSNAAAQYNEPENEP